MYISDVACVEWGVEGTTSISSVPLLSWLKKKYKNTGYLMIVMFIFDRYHHRSAVVIPVKYENDSNDPGSTFAKREISLIEIIARWRSVTPTQVWYIMCFIARYSGSFHLQRLLWHWWQHKNITKLAYKTLMVTQRYHKVGSQNIDGDGSISQSWVQKCQWLMLLKI